MRLRYRFMASGLLFLAVLGLATDAGAQSLGKVAEREAKRRANADPAKSVKSYSQEDVAKAKGGTYTQMEGSASLQATTRPLATPPSGTERTEPPSAETRWRTLANERRAAVPAAKAEIEQAEEFLGKTQSVQGHCWEAHEKAQALAAAHGIAYKCRAVTWADVCRAQKDLDQARARL
ncbi:MAG: hypothetical protein ACREBE_16230, partial [bacterium]